MKIAILALAAAMAPAAAAQQITVGANAQVSADRASNWHGELWASAHPTDARRLIACGVTQPIPASKQVTSVYYTSVDAGRTWKRTLEVDEGGTLNLDPVCEYGPDGVGYASVLALGGIREPTSPAVMLEKDRQTVFYRSSDGGLTWSAPTRLPFIDRQGIAADGTGGPFNGRVYMQGLYNAPLVIDQGQVSGVALFRSLDGGRTFQSPVPRYGGSQFWIQATGNTLVLDDGTVIFPIAVQHIDQDLQPGQRPTGELAVLRSADGGETLDQKVTVVNYFPGAIPTIAADKSQGTFRNRVYAAWVDGHEGGRTRLYVAHSDDRGKTWSGAQRVDDTPPRSDMKPRFTGMAIDDLARPVIGVNKDGVVGVIWYDRRSVAQGLGWELRFSASLDGGDTFLPSVSVSSKPSVVGAGENVPVGLGWILTFQQEGKAHGSKDGIDVPVGAGMGGGYFYDEPGHTNGMAVGADGTFHPVFIDTRTGVAHIWTAPVTVAGRVVRNGAAELASLIDASDKVMLTFSQVGFDRSSGVLTLRIAMRNSSNDTLRAPFHLRLVALESEIGPVQVQGADNMREGLGAMWDLSSLVQGGVLAPSQSSGDKVVTFRFTAPKMVNADGEVPREIAKPRFRLLVGKAGR